MKPKIIVSIVFLVIVASIFATQSVFAQSNQVTSTLSLTHLNVQLTYPTQVVPGESATINLTAQAKDSFQLTSLTLQVYLADQNNFRQLLSTTVAQNTVMPSGNQINKQIQVTVPSDAPRTSLVALVTESVSVSVGMPSYNYPYGYPYWNGYGNVYGYGSYPYYFSPPSYYYYSAGSYTYQSSSDDAIAPLSYVLATTPEYVTLQSQYQQLKAQNQQLQQQLQTSQNSTAQKDSTISNLNNQLSLAQRTTTLLEIVTVILAIAVVALAALHFKPTRTTKTEEKTTGV
jgi:hypothetical protein